MKKTILTFSAVLALTGTAQAADLTVPHTFAPGTQIKSSEVNANFNSIYGKYGELSSKVEALIASSQTIPLSKWAWAKQDCGNWEETSDGLKVYGTAYRKGTRITLKRIYDFRNSVTFVKWATHGAGFSSVGPRILNIAGGNTFTTSNSSGGTTVIADDTSYYTRIAINADNSYQIITATGNYDTNGGTVFKTESGTVSGSSLPYMSNSVIEFSMWDNYGGTGTYNLISEVKTNAVPKNIPTLSAYSFEGGSIPAGLTVNGAWAVDAAGFNSSKSAYLASVSTSQSLGVTATNASLVSLKMKVTNGGDYDAIVKVNGVEGYRTGVPSQECWVDLFMPLDSSLTNVIAVTSRQGSPNIWVDDLTSYK
ncbi:MAG: hypothetical protein HQL75_14385 [Magnetococcales bacterium]|nr:hypothetical protein [Magnetococcales bacterium]